MQIIYQIIYQPLINKVLRSIIKAIPGWPQRLRIQPSGILPVVLMNGKEIRLQTNQTCFVTNMLFWEADKPYEYTNIFLDLFPRIKTFFDVGSNIGYYSIAAGVTAPHLKVYAFDPSPGPNEYLRRNIKLNVLSNVYAYPIALSNQNGTASFHFAYNSKYTYLENNTLGGSGHLSDVRENPTTFALDVKTQTLDSFVETENIQTIDLIKLDVEEAEHMVIEGGKNSILRFRPIVVCEVFSTEMLQQIRAQIMEYDFFAFRFQDNRLVKEQILADSTVNQIENYFFVPVEKEELIKKFISSN